MGAAYLREGLSERLQYWLYSSVSKPAPRANCQESLVEPRER